MAGHRLSDVDLDDPNFDRQPYQAWVAYGRSKTANVLFAVEFDRRLRDRGVRACAVHPGGIDTEPGRHLDEASRAFAAERRKESGSLQKSVAAGAATTIWAGVVASPDEVCGRYAEDCAVSPVLGAYVAPDGRAGAAAYAVDLDHAAALWIRSEELVGQEYGDTS